MAATQPIPRNAPNTADIQAAKVLALHNNSTNARQKVVRVAQFDPRSAGSAGTRVGGAVSVDSGS